MAGLTPDDTVRVEAAMTAAYAYTTRAAYALPGGAVRALQNTSSRDLGL